MKIFKKLLSLLIAVSILFSFVPYEEVRATDSVTFLLEVNKNVLKVGEKVLITLKSQDAIDDFYTAQAFLDYDKEKLSYVAGSENQILNTKTGTSIYNLSAIGRLTSVSNPAVNCQVIAGEAFYTVEFEAIDVGTVNLSLAESACTTGPPTTVIPVDQSSTQTINIRKDVTGEQAFTMQVPVKNGVVDRSVNSVTGGDLGTSYELFPSSTGIYIDWEVQDDDGNWSNFDGNNFTGNSIYRAIFYLMYNDLYDYSSEVSATVNGEAVDGISKIPNQNALRITKVFPRTALKSLDSIEIQSADSVDKPVIISGNHEDVVSAQLDISAVGTFDDLSTENVEVTWTIENSPAPEGVSISGSTADDYKLNITNKVNVDTIELKAQKDGKTATKSITVNTAALSPMEAEINSDDKTVDVPTYADTSTVVGSFKLDVYDQYGDKMNGLNIVKTVTKDGAIVTDSDMKWDTVNTDDLLIMYTAREGVYVLKMETDDLSVSDSINITVNKADSVVTVFELGGGVSSLDVPTAATGTSTATAFTTTVKDQYNTDMTGQTVSWEIIPAYKGVSVDDNGQVSIDYTAQAGTVNLRATCAGKVVNKSIIVNRAASAVTSVKIFRDGALKTADTLIIPPNTSTQTYSYTYVSKVFDQYDEEMSSETATLSLVGSQAGVSLSGNTISVDKTTNNLSTLALKATSDSDASVEESITLTFKQKDPATVSLDDIEITYGDSVNPQATSDKTGGTFTYTYTGTGSTTYASSTTPPTDAGTYSILTIYEDDDNYGTCNSNLTINQKTISSSDLEYSGSIEKTYDASKSCDLAQVDVKASAEVGSDDVKANGTSEYSSKDVGSGNTITFTATSLNNPNYKLDDGGVILSKSANITAKDVTVDVTAATKVYGTDNPNFSASLASGSSMAGTETVADLNLTFTTTANASSSVGTYDVSGTSSNNNYNVTVNGTDKLTITKADLTVIALAEQNLNYQSGLSKITAVNTTASGVLSDQVDGTVSWYKDSAYATALVDSDISTLNIGDELTAYWRFEHNNTNYNSPVDGSTKFTIVDVPEQNITFAQASVTKTYGDDKFTNSATNNSSGGGAITYSVTAGSDVVDVDVSTGEVTIKSAGTATVRATAAAVVAEYKETSIEYNISVEQKTISSSDLEYSGTVEKEYDTNTSCDLVQVDVKASAEVGSDDVKVSGGATYASKDVGSGNTVTFIATGLNNLNYKLATGEVKLIKNANITAKDVTVDVNPATKVYGTDNPDFSASLASGSSMAGTETIADLSLAFTTTATKNSPVGIYNVSASSTNANYNVTVNGANKLTITKANLNVNAPTTAEINYQSVVSQITAVSENTTGVLGEQVSGNVTWYKDSAYTQTLEDDDISTLDVGDTITAYWRFTHSNANYNSPVEGSITFTIADLPDQDVSFAQTSVDKTYGDAKFTNVATNATSGGGAITYSVAAGTAVVDVDASTGEVTIKSAGTATVRATAAGVTSEYSQTSVEYTVNVEQKTISSGDLEYSTSIEKEYDANTSCDVVQVDAKASAQVGSDDVKVNGTSTYASKNVGSGNIITFVATGLNNSNYKLAAGEVKLIKDANITAKDVTVDVNPATKVYGTDNPDFSASLASGSSMAGTETIADLSLTFTTTATASSPVGTYNVSGTSSNTNYSVTVNGTDKLSITKADLTVTALAEQNLNYQSGLSKITAVNTIADGVLSEQVDGTVSWYKDSAYTTSLVDSDISSLNVGDELTAYWRFEHNNTNYNSPVDGNTKFTIVDVPEQSLSFAQDTVSKTYGDANFTNVATNATNGGGAITYSVTAGSAVVDVDASTGEVTIKSAGTATVRATAAAVVAEYKETSVEYNISVEQKTISSSDLEYSGTIEKTYDANTSCDITQVDVKASAQVGSDDVKVNGTATYNSKNVGVGNYITFTATSLSNTNYKLETANLTFLKNANIKAKDVTVNVSSVSKVYGSQNPSFTGTLDAGSSMAGTETIADLNITYSTSAGQGSNVGVYDVSGTSSNTNYNVTVNGTNKFTIAKAVVSINADANQNIKVGSGLNKITAVPSTATGAMGESISGTVSWYSDAAYTVAATDSDISSLNINDTVRLYWRFTHSNTNHISNKNGSTLFTIVDLDPQDVEFATHSISKTYGDANFTQTATNNTAGGGNITYSVESGSAVVDVDANTGEVTIKSAGTAVIKATAALVPGQFDTGIDTYTVEVSKKMISASDIEYTASISKVYDASTDCDLTQVDLKSSAAVGSDVVKINGTATYNDKDVVNADKVSFVASSTDNVNYKITGGLSIDLPATITAKAITLNIDSVNKVFGTANPNFTSQLAAGSTLATGESLSDLLITYSTVANQNSDVGTYDVSASSANTNYSVSFNGDDVFVINKAGAVNLTAINLQSKYSNTTEIVNTLLSDMPSNAGALQYVKVGETDTDNILASWSVSADGVLRYTLNSGLTFSSQTAQLSISISSTNYEDSSLTVNIALSDKDTPIITVEDFSKVYDGNAVNVNQLSKSARFNGTSLAGSWSFSPAASPTDVDDSGVYTVVFTPDDSTNYSSASKNINITITKAAPTGTPSYLRINEDGKTLADAMLSLDGGSITIAGTIAWVDDNGNVLADTTVVEKDRDYKWLFTPTDTVNYSTLSGLIKLYFNSSGDIIGSGGGGSSEEDSENGEMDTNISVDGDTANVELSEEQIDKLEESIEDGDELLIDLSEENVNGANLSDDLLDILSEAENNSSLSISFPDATVEFDETVLDSLADSGDIYVVVESVKQDRLTDEQQRTLGKQLNNVVLDIGVFSSGVRLRNFNGGKISVKVPYELLVDENSDHLTIWYLRDDGSIEHIDSVYNADTNSMEFDTIHLSKYVIINFPFEDVTSKFWGYEDIAFVYNQDVLRGMSKNEFAPNTAMSRAMLVTALYRIAGEPEVDSELSFVDTEKGAWYEKALKWAVKEKIVEGYDEQHFGPNDILTREQMVSIISRYAKASPSDSMDNIARFSDYNEVADYAKNSMIWAIENGIITGMDDETLSPRTGATRAQIATVISRFLKMGKLKIK